MHTTLTHPSWLLLVPGICVPGAPLIAVGGWEGDLLLTWGQEGSGSEDPEKPHSPQPTPTRPTLTETQEHFVLLPF